MKKRVLSILTLLGATLLIILPIISAYSYGYYNSPLDYLDNEWVMFAIITVVFFTIIYYTVNRTFKNNVVSGVLALGLSLLIALTMARRSLLYGYAGEEIGAWILIATILIGIGFLIRFSHEAFGYLGVIVVVVGVWLLIYNTDPYEIIPSELLTDTFIKIYEFASSILGLIILLVISIPLAKTKEGKSGWEMLSRAMSRKN